MFFFLAVSSPVRPAALSGGWPPPGGPKLVGAWHGHGRSSCLVRRPVRRQVHFWDTAPGRYLNYRVLALLVHLVLHGQFRISRIRKILSAAYCCSEVRKLQTLTQFLCAKSAQVAGKAHQEERSRLLE